MTRPLRFEESTLDGLDLDDYLELAGEIEEPTTIDPSSPYLAVKSSKDGCCRQAYCACSDELPDDLHEEF